MEQIFSSNSEEIIQKHLDFSIQNEIILDSNESLEKYFDIDQTVEWIKDKQFKRVALQFPDELLNHSIKVCSRIKQKLNTKNEDILVFILGDTSYGSCCVDVVAGEHCNAECIVHFGHSCLSIVEKIPVFYVFEKSPLNIDSVEREIELLLKQNEQPLNKLIVLYDVCYFYLYDELCQRFSKNINVYISNIDMTMNNNVSQTNTSTTPKTKILFSRLLPNELSNDNESPYSFFYIGTKESFLNPFLFYFNKNKFFHHNPKSSMTISIPFSKTNKELMRRYFLIEKARDSNIFGILIGTMSVANYAKAVDHVSYLLKRVNKRFYSFLIGKLNCPKLNNFMEVDMYVLVACNENSLINSKELNKPIITIYELEIAFNCARLWGEEFICDYKQLLSGGEHHKHIELSEKESDVSLITGANRFLYSTGDIKEKSSLISRDSTLALMHHSGAGEFLQNRSWSGLEQNLGKTEVVKAIEGKKGIAARYSNEIE